MMWSFRGFRGAGFLRSPHSRLINERGRRPEMGGKVGRGVDPGNCGKGIFTVYRRRPKIPYTLLCNFALRFVKFTLQGRERTVPGGGRRLPRSSVFALRLVSAELVDKEVGPPVLTQGEKERH